MTMQRKITQTAAETTLAAEFAALGDHGSERAAAFAAFAASGLPTRRDEAWHYTDLRSAMASAAPLAAPPDTARVEQARKLLATCERVGDIRLVLVDGHYVPALSDPAPSGVAATALASFIRSEPADPVVALNDAFARGGLSLIIEAGLDPSIEIVHCAPGDAPASLYSHNAITLNAGAKARIFERFIGAGAGSQRNALTRVTLGPSAKGEMVTLLDDNAELHLESQVVTIAGHAEFNAFALVSGGALARRQLFVRHREPNASISLGGLALLQGRRHADTTLVVEHGAPRGRSREYFKHIIADEATGVYQGKVIVAPGAQKTDGGMKSQAILLSPTATMNNKPELEIFADDVVCGHGATVGALDAEQTFYLQARGIPRAEAEAMLLEAFGADAIDRVGDEAVAEFLRQRMRAWLAARG